MKPRTRVFSLLAITFATAAAGCELIVDFDRTKIPVDSGSGTPTDSGGEPGTDSGDQDSSSSTDAGSDAPSDAPEDG